jgi:hypothetical protein
MARAVDTGTSWKPQSEEDRLLHKYISSVGGDLYLEVPIGGPGGDGKWPTGCTTRRLNGVRLSGRLTNGSVFRFRGSKQAFVERIHHGAVELIEVKTWLGRYVIGQAIAGRHMFERQYKVCPRRVVILCAHGDTALEWVCKRENILVKRI